MCRAGKRWCGVVWGGGVSDTDVMDGVDMCSELVHGVLVHGHPPPTFLTRLRLLINVLHEIVSSSAIEQSS